MDPLVVIEFIKKVIDDKIKNLHPDVEKMIIEEVLLTGFDKEYKIKYFIRDRLKLPKVGSDKKIYWERRGWSREEIEIKRIIKKMPSSPMKVDNWLNKINEKTGKLYTKEEANYKIKSFRKLNKEYWLERGFSEEESLDKVKDFQKENSDKFVKKILENPENYTDRTETQLNYWVKKGYNLDDSLENLKKRQDTTSLNYLLSKYNDETAGIKYLDTKKRKVYERSLEFYTDKGYTTEDALSVIEEHNRKRICKSGVASKESLNLLIPIYNFCLENKIKVDNNIYFGYEDNKEYFIRDDKNFFLYDFVIKDLKIIIEYHGIMFHPNPSWIDSIKESWRCLFTNQTYIEKYNFDKYKESLSIKNGFDIYVYYSDEDINYFLEKIKEKIIEKINEK